MQLKMKLLALLAMLSPKIAFAYDANHTGADIGAMAIDLVGYFIQGLIDNASTLVTLLITVIIVGLVVTLLAAIFGMFKVFGGKHR
jgi:hypothetical protein